MGRYISASRHRKNHGRTSMSKCCVFQNVPLGPPDVSVQRAVLAMNSPTRPHVPLAANHTDPLLSLGCSTVLLPVVTVFLTKTLLLYDRCVCWQLLWLMTITA